MKGLVVDWQRLCWQRRWGQTLVHMPCLIHGQGPGDETPRHVWFRWKRAPCQPTPMHCYCFASPVPWDTGTTFKTCGWQPLLHNPRRVGGGGGDASAGLGHQADCVASVKAASAWRERGSLVRSCGCVRLKEERRVGSDISTNPPLSRPLLSAEIPVMEEVEGWVVTMLTHPATLWKHGEASWEAWERDAKEKSVSHSALPLYYSAILCF